MDQHPIQGGVEILSVTSCNGNRDKLRPDGPLGSYADFTYLIQFTKKRTFIKENWKDKGSVNVIAIYTVENCHSPSYSPTNDTKERAQDQTAHHNSVIRALHKLVQELRLQQLAIFPIRELPQAHSRRAAINRIQSTIDRGSDVFFGQRKPDQIFNILARRFSAFFLL